MDLRSVAVALVVALAGCGAAVGGAGESGTGDRTPTLTPATVPEVTATPVPLPPGVTTDRVTNPDRLLSAHRAALADRSYTLRVRVATEDSVSTRLTRYETPARYYTHDTTSDKRGNVTQFANGSRVYARMEYAGVTEYGVFDNNYPPQSQTVTLSRLFLRVGNVTVFRRSVNGDTVFVVAGSYPVHPRTDRLRNFTVRAVVRPNGLIRSLNTTYTRVGPATRTNVTRSFVYSDVGETTVERPEWVEREFNVSGD